MVKGTLTYVKNDNVDQALRRFKKTVQNFGLLNDLRDKQFYEKPTAVRKRKKAAAKQRWRRQVQSQTLPKKLY